MKNVIKIALIAAFSLTCLSSCFKAPDEIGYLGENIYLKGADTMFVTIGSKARSNDAWLDNSTKPCHFEIVAVRKANEDGTFTQNDQFLQTYPVRMWKTPYDYLTDTTKVQVMDKIEYQDKFPVVINEVNGQLVALETTSEIEGLAEGDVYHIDVQVSNSKGTRLLEDYAIIKFQAAAASSEFIIQEITNGICVVGKDATGVDYSYFPYYDLQDITSNSPDFSAWHEALLSGAETYESKTKTYGDNGTVRMLDHFAKVDNPSDYEEGSVIFKFRFVDPEGNVFDPSKYTTYSTGTQSYIDYSTEQEVKEDWLVLKFPITPWPVKTDLRSYLKGEIYHTFDNLDVEQLKADLKAKKIPSNSGSWDDSWEEEPQWYVRLRSIITMYEPGTYELWVEVPYTSAK